MSDRPGDYTHAEQISAKLPGYNDLIGTTQWTQRGELVSAPLRALSPDAPHSSSLHAVEGTLLARTGAYDVL